MPATLTPQNLGGIQRQPNNATLGTLLAGQFGEQVVTQLGGKYAKLALDGILWHGLSAATGAAVPIVSTTAPVCALWNPAGSGKNVVLATMAMGYVSGTSAPGAVHLGFTLNAGNAVATAAPFSVFTHVDPTGGIIGAAYTGAARWSPATATLTAAGTLGPTTGLTWLTTTATNTDGATVRLVDFDGKFVVPPGVAIYPLAVLASVTLFTIALSWYEIPA